MNILKQELRMGRKSLIIWCLSLAGILVLFMLIYPSISSQLEDFQKVFKSFPIEFQRALGIADLQLNTILSYYQFPFTYILLAGAVQAMNMGVAVISSEIREKTGDFLFVKPVTRNRIISMKIMAVLVQILITNAFVFVAALITVSILSAEPYNVKLFVLITSSLLFIQIFFASLGLFVSAFLRRIRTVLPISMGVVFIFYIVFLLNETLKDDKLGLISPFGYFDLSELSKTMNYDSLYLLLWFVLVGLFIFLTFRLFARKDLPSI
ncbi:ABC transporter permease subunit [Acetobacterium paludosum]|uniref:ABC transporter permease subunit n=1 Tax=Acetobacterium paludosum TaxID=52693 RepID=A0A923HZ05_9FIRM|nr:ABC transporter permease subunit [Acetobacterium paludosum]MBC3889209.1 ABC transporter permease subunit [Acetobacterium paludosum]